MIIRHATREDALRILRLQKIAFSRFSDHLEFQNETLSSVYQDLDQASILVGELQDQIIGVIRARVEKGVCHLFRVAVDPDHQRKGYGFQLMRTMEEKHVSCHRFQLDVHPDNSGALRLYQKLGYEICSASAMSPEYLLLQKSNVSAGRPRPARPTAR